MKNILLRRKKSNICMYVFIFFLLIASSLSSYSLDLQLPELDIAEGSGNSVTVDLKEGPVIVPDIDLEEKENLSTLEAMGHKLTKQHQFSLSGYFNPFFKTGKDFAFAVNTYINYSYSFFKGLFEAGPFLFFDYASYYTQRLIYRFELTGGVSLKYYYLKNNFSEDRIIPFAGVRLGYKLNRIRSDFLVLEPYTGVNVFISQQTAVFVDSSLSFNYALNTSLDFGWKTEFGLVHYLDF